MTKKTRLVDCLVLAIFGPLLLLGDLLMEAFPNIHLVGVLLVVVTAVYRTGALIPLYIYVFLNGLYAGFALWWMPYVYVWLPLWGLVMLVPRRLPAPWRMGLYVAACAAHGYLFSVFYVPGQAVLFGLDWQGMLTWVAAGLPFDALHGTGNLVLGTVLIYPLTTLLHRLKKSVSR